MGAAAAAAAMSAHIYGGSSVIRMIIRNPPWRSGDPYPTPHPTLPHASIPSRDPHANPKRI